MCFRPTSYSRRCRNCRTRTAGCGRGAVGNNFNFGPPAGKGVPAVHAPTRWLTQLFISLASGTIVVATVASHAGAAAAPDARFGDSTWVAPDPYAVPAADSDPAAS